MRNASTLLCREDGGVESEVGGAAGTDVYFMGIIDILQVRVGILRGTIVDRTYGIHTHLYM